MTKNDEGIPEEFKNFIHKKKCLIIESATPIRRAIKSFLMEFGFKNDVIEYANSFEDGEAKLKSLQSHVIFCCDKFEDSEKSGFDLF